MRDSSVGLRPWGLTRWLPNRVPSGLLEVYLAVNFKVHEINQGVHKLAQTSKVITKKIKNKNKKKSSKRATSYHACNHTCGLWILVVSCGSKIALVS